MAQLGPYNFDRWPAPGELCTFDVMCRRALLLYDKIYMDSSGEWSYLEIPPEFTFGVPSMDQDTKLVRDKNYKDYLESRQINFDWGAYLGFGRRETIRRFAERGVPIVDAYDSNFTPFVESGDIPQSYLKMALIKSIGVVDELSLEWDQVREFRKDKASRSQYRALRLWLNSGVEANSFAHASDMIESKVENYDKALKKHGIQTASGALSLVIDLRTFLPSLGLASIGAFTHEWLGMLGAGALIGGKIAVHLIDQSVRLDEVKRGPDHEVAIIYSISKTFEAEPSALR